MRQLGSELSRLVQLTRIKNRGLGAEPIATHPLGDFCDFSAKNSNFAPFGSNFAPFWSHVKELTC